MITVKALINIVIYLASLALVLFCTKAIKWNNFLDNKKRFESIVIFISVNITIAFGLGSFINAIIAL